MGWVVSESREGVSDGLRSGLLLKSIEELEPVDLGFRKHTKRLPREVKEG